MTVTGQIARPFAWIAQERRRGLIIYTLAAVAVAYLAVGVVFAFTDPSWRASDTFSMVAGCLFFLIGAGLAVAHEMRLDAEQKILTQQHVILLAVQHGVENVREISLETRNHLAIKEERVQLDEPPLEHSLAGTFAAPVAQTSVSDDRAAPVDGARREAAEASPLDATLADFELLAPSADKKGVLERFALASAIEAGADEAAVMTLLKKANMYALGQLAGDTSVAGQGTESDILHFTIDDEGGNEQVLLPIFTSNTTMREALSRNPDWLDLSVLEINGADLLKNIDDDVTLVTNPWTPGEYQLSPDSRATDGTQTASS